MCVTPADTATSPTLTYVKMSSTSNNQPKESSSSGDEHIPKIRKTYTITKQRERWTEEEHNKFLEALKLHGRAWRRIEEHIGTKTAVQIRSHAQKFFSKVVRESSCNNTSSVKPIEIPPPRPKRKPMHPYPRKLGNTSSKDLPNLQKPERSISPIQSISDDETRSPTSVLTTIGSDTMGSSASHIAKHCKSLDSYTTSSSPTGLSLTEQENICQSHPSSNEEGNGSPQSGSTLPTMTTEGKSDMELEDALVDAPVTSLKLFGRTVLVTDTSKPNSQVVMKKTQCLESLLPTGKEETPEELEKDMQSSTLIQSENVTRQDSSVVSGQGAWNLWSCGIPQLFYCLPLQRAQLNAAQNTTVAPPPWWPFCGGPPFPLMHLSNSGPNKHPSEPDRETPDSDNKHLSAEKEPAEEQQPKLEESVPLTNPKPTSEKQVKGFVPYKRCSAERESMQTEISEDRDRQRIRLCL